MIQALLDSLVQAGVLSLAALGLSLSWGVGRFANVAHAQYAMVGAYVAYAFSGVLPGGLGTAVVVSVLITTAVGGLLYRFVLRRLAARSSSTALIGSLALAIVVQAAVQSVAGPQPRRLPVDPQPGIRVGDVVVTQNALFIAIVAAVTLVVIALVLRFTRLGRAVQYVKSNSTLAGVSGIDAPKTTTIVFAASAGLAGLSGVLLAVDGTASVTMGDNLLIPVFAAAIVGGIGRPWGAVAAAVGLAALSNVLLSISAFGFSIPLGYRPAIGFVALILVLLFSPEGLFASRRRHA